MSRHACAARSRDRHRTAWLTPHEKKVRADAHAMVRATPKDLYRGGAAPR